MEGQELHIAGILVHAVPAELRRVAESIAQLPGAKVHALDASGKAVVTIEAARTAEIQTALALMQKLPGVLTAALVYQHGEPLEAMNQEVTDETDSPRFS